MLEPIARQLSADDARALTEGVKRDAEALWRKLLDLYEGAAHTALGYGSWHAYCSAEFGFRRSRAYQLLDVGRVVAAFDSTDVEPPATEAQARALAPVLRGRGRDQMIHVWDAATGALRIKRPDGTSQMKVTQKQVERAVDEWVQREMRPPRRPTINRDRKVTEREIRKLSAGETRVGYIREAVLEATELLRGAQECDLPALRDARPDLRRLLADALAALEGVGG
jgi:hypothetical protein